jgi:hypothetical protein
VEGNEKLIMVKPKMSKKEPVMSEKEMIYRDTYDYSDDEEINEDDLNSFDPDNPRCEDPCNSGDYDE